MNTGELNATARALVAKNRGILAADESSGTIKKRFDTIKLESTEESRRAYREMLFTAPGAQQYISGVIMYDETLRQKTKDGMAFPAYLAKSGMLPGIKVDLGAKPLPGFPGETMTEGLDGLRERLADYYKLGARFAKWRAVINIDSGIPTRYAIDANAEGLARYASLCQEAGIVPIVEPEVLMDGGHTLERCEEVTNVVLDSVFSHLFAARVALEGMVLKPNMVIPGKKSSDQASPARIAEATVRTLKRQVPSAVPGIAFLSGGQSPIDATLHLNLMHAAGPLPWALTFSYGRALQEDALKAWAGQQSGLGSGQKALALRAKLNGLAATGDYSAAMEASAA
jgi:fructose-bisphosphate aldolase, class I